MSSWSSRPREEAYLLNPIYLSLLLRQAAEGYRSEAHVGLPYGLAFVVMPATLFEPARTALPSTVRTSLYVWLERHRELRYEVAVRAIAMKRYTKEGVISGLNAGILELREIGAIGAGGTLVRPKALRVFSTPEMTETMVAARKVGRWLARAGDEATILTAWGVRL
jgi:hypothetical protein